MSRNLVLLLLLWALQACTSPPPLPEDRFYDLRPRLGAEQAVERTRQVHLVVRRPRVDALRGARNLVFSPDGVEMRQYHHHFWADRPERMLHRVLLERLRASGLFASVGSLPVEAEENAELRAEILRLDRVRSDAGWKVDVAWRFTYFPRRGEPPAFSHLYEQKLEVQAEEMGATIEAFNQAGGRILQQLLQDLSGT